MTSTLSQRTGRVDFDLYLITDRKQTNGRPLTDVVEESLVAGVRCVQLREKDLSSRDLYELALELRKITARHGARLIINDRIDIALAVEADGVHLGGESIPTYRVRKLLGERALIGVSCHNLVNAITAQEKGADFITFGPIFYTPSKARYGAPLGLDRLAEVPQAVSLPIFALGGVTLEHVGEVMDHGATGIALISAVIAAPSPADASRNLLCRIAQQKSGA